MTVAPGQDESWQQYFAGDDGIYLLNHSIGKMPLSARAHAQHAFFDTWEQQTADAWPIWLDRIDTFRLALAGLLNSVPDAFCPQANVSSGLTKVIDSIPNHSARTVIVCTEHDFPSVGFVLRQAERSGLSIRMIPKTADTQDPDVWRDVLTDDVRCVLVTHVHYNTNRLIPVRQICRIARECDVLSIVDTAQSIGVVPIDLADWSADVVLGSCIKWLCGGPGAGFLWIRPELTPDLQPTDVGWFSHRDPFEFDIHHFDYAPDSARFWGGTPSVLPYVIAANSIQLIREIGVDTIYAHNQRLTAILLNAVDPACVRSPLDLGQKGGTTVFSFANQNDVEQALHKADVKFDAREYGIRLSPHIYNSVQEMQVVRDCFAMGHPPDV